MRKAVPRPGSLLTLIVPPCASTIPWQRESPSPVPWPRGLVVKNGSKIRDWISAGMPGPLSATSRNTLAAGGS
jgi:hypothetical protein